MAGTAATAWTKKQSGKLGGVQKITSMNTKMDPLLTHSLGCPLPLLPSLPPFLSPSTSGHQSESHSGKFFFCF